MRAESRQPLILCVAYVTAATGLFSIVRGWGSYGHFDSIVRVTLAVAGPATLLFSLVVLLVPIAKLLAAAGLLLRRGWARPAAIAVLSVDAITLIRAAVRLHVVSIMRGVSAPPLAGASVVHTESLWPTYLVAAISVVSVLALISGASRPGLSRAI
jgi:hypothetical protein